ncbi:hypothetical protein BH10BAC2_BH10BAC2_41010 [soil metagenome]
MVTVSPAAAFAGSMRVITGIRAAVSYILLVHPVKKITNIPTRRHALQKLILAKDEKLLKYGIQRVEWLMISNISIYDIVE